METATAFTVHLSPNPTAAGLSLRGNCQGSGPAQQLEKAIDEMVAAGSALIWVDCRYLTSLNWQGQRAVFNANQRARLAGRTLYWCGLEPAVLTQLTTTGLHLLLSLLPATGYQGPVAVLQ
jgi:anti-anti-sigma regulatory factor